MPPKNKKIMPTLDDKHTEMVKHFNKIETITIPNLQKQKEELKAKTPSDPAEARDIREKMRDISKEIARLSREKNDYFLTNSRIIFKYFEDKKNIEKSAVTSTKLHAFFGLAAQPTTTTHQNQTEIQQYLANLDTKFITTTSFMANHKICSVCKCGELVQHDDEGMFVCGNPNCSIMVPYYTETEKSTYKEPPKEMSYMAYDKLNHFKEIIVQYQGKETANIPETDIEKIRVHVKKMRLVPDQINHDQMRDILSQLHMPTKYNDHCNYIKKKLGVPMKLFPRDLEVVLHELFIQLLEPYSKVCQQNAIKRTNFSHYHYALYKLLELLEQNEFLDDIPLLKTRDRMMQLDFIWEKICEIKGWKFIPTV